MDLDRTDGKILRALQEDARRSFRELARLVGVSVPTVSARVANLERLGVVSGYHAAIDPERLRQTQLFLILKCSSRAADSVGRAVSALREVRWAIRTGASRIVVEAILPTRAEVDPFLKRLRTFGGVVSLEHHVAAKQLKDKPMATLSGRLAADVACFECGQMIEGEPIRLRMDGRTHYLCCPSCKQLYEDRYARIKAAARAA